MCYGIKMTDHLLAQIVLLNTPLMVIFQGLLLYMLAIWIMMVMWMLLPQQKQVMMFPGGLMMVLLVMIIGQKQLLMEILMVHDLYMLLIWMVMDGWMLLLLQKREMMFPGG